MMTLVLFSEYFTIYVFGNFVNGCVGIWNPLLFFEQWNSFLAK